MDFVAADGVFLGRMIASSREAGRARMHYTFAVRQSWKGVEADTAHVVVPDSGGCEAMYLRGQSYLVLAERTADGFVPPPIPPAVYHDPSWLEVYLRVAGAPERTFSIDTVASLEALVPPSTPYVPGPMRLFAEVYRGDGRSPGWQVAGGVRVSVAGTGVAGTTTPRGHVELRGLDTRWYRFRFEFPDGTVHEEYFRPGCDGWPGPGPCGAAAARFYIGPDVPHRANVIVPLPRQ